MDEICKLQMTNISKRFGGVHALEKVHFDLRPGEIHALVGENGAGKSTLIKILSGMYTPDEGEIIIDGKKVNITNERDGLAHGISVIYQEFALAGDLTVAENIFIDNITNGAKIMHWRDLNKRARDLLDELDFGQIDEKAKVEDLPSSYQQVVEICKAFTRNASIIVLDEPTALLTSNEIEKLFILLRSLKNAGTSIIYISHRLNEIFELCDRITVFKDGTYVDTVSTNEIRDGELVKLMIGRSLQEYFPTREVEIAETLLDVDRISSGRLIKDISFHVCKGEVLGLGGLVGAGRTETAEAIIGLRKMSAGEIRIAGNPVQIHNAIEAVKSGMSMLSEDRKHQGVLLQMTVKENITMSILKKFCGRFNKIRGKIEREYVQSMISQLRIKTPSMDMAVYGLSGGNQQKVSMAKVLAAGNRILILDEPTRGVDVGSKIEIYKIINELAEAGNAIVMISSEMAELIGMCDRAMILRNGKIAGELGKHELTEENIIRLAMGV